MEQVRRAYGAAAATYIELFGRRSRVHIDDLSLIDRRLSIRPGTVLDVGCGPGHLTAHLRDRMRHPGSGDTRPHAALVATAIATRDR